MHDEEERDEGEGAPGMRGDVRTHGVHVPGADQNDQDNSENASGVSRAVCHRADGKEPDRNG